MSVVGMPFLVHIKILSAGTPAERRPFTRAFLPAFNGTAASVFPVEDIAVDIGPKLFRDVEHAI